MSQPIPSPDTLDPYDPSQPPAEEPSAPSNLLEAWHRLTRILLNDVGKDVRRVRDAQRRLMRPR